MSVPAAYLGVILIWSTTPLAIKWSGEGSGILFAISSRMLIGTILCYATLRLLKVELPWHRKAVQTYMSGGIGIFGAMLSVYWGSQYISSGLISVIFGLTPIFTGIMATAWLGERGLSLARFSGIALGLFGLAVIFSSDISLDGEIPNAVYGMAAVVLATFLHSLSMVSVKGVGAHLPALTATTGGLLLSTPVLIATWYFFDGHMPGELPTHSLAAIVYLGVFGSALGFVLFFYALKHLEASRIALIPLITPVLALLIGYSINNEVLSMTVITGTLCIMSGLLVYEWGPLPVRILRKHLTRRVNSS